MAAAKKIGIKPLKDREAAEKLGGKVMEIKNGDFYQVDSLTHSIPFLVPKASALLVFGERLNLYQWIGVLMAIFSFFMLSRSGKKEGIDFKHNKWIFFVVLASMLGAISGLYDKYLMAPLNQGGIGLDRMVVQSWYNIYQFFMMGAMLLLLWWPKRKSTTPFHWHWAIILISIFLSAADFVYFYALSLDGAMISIVSMIRRGSVIVIPRLSSGIWRDILSAVPWRLHMLVRMRRSLMD